MNSAWIVVGLGIGIAGLVLICIATWFRRGTEPDLGTVSTQWIAEQRLDGHDGHR